MDDFPFVLSLKFYKIKKFYLIYKIYLKIFLFYFKPCVNFINIIFMEKVLQ